MQLHCMARCFGLLFLLLVNFAHAAKVPYQGNAFALGIQMGFASMQRTQPGDADAYRYGGCGSNGGPALSKRALEEANKQAGVLTSRGYPLPSNELAGWAAKTHCSVPSLEEIEFVRSAISAALSNKSTPHAQAYNLGVNLGIAEGFSSTGNDVNRQVVYLSLQDALKSAQDLKLDTTTLNECLLLAKGATPLSEIRSKLNSLRATYQTQL